MWRVMQIHVLQPGARVHMTAVKNGDTAVGGTFNEVAGKVDLAHFPDLRGEVRINLTSLVTGNDKRDANVKAYFFEVTGPSGPEAVFAPQRFEGASALPAPGARVQGVLAGRLDFHGFAEDVTLAVSIEHDNAGVYWLRSTAPLRFSIGAWNMDQKKVALMEQCKHKSIEDVVLLTLEASLK